MSSDNIQRVRLVHPVHPLAAKALQALTESGYEDKPGMCQKFQRQVVAAVYGNRFERYRTGTAHGSALRWRKSQYALPGGTWGQVGDIYYWYEDSGQPNGHTAIRILGNRVAENSVVHGDANSGGRGTRKLGQIQKPDLIIRLPWEL